MVYAITMYRTTSIYMGYVINVLYRYGSGYSVLISTSMEIVYVKEKNISCTGADYPDDHPKVYYTLDKGEAICGYCNIKFILKDKIDG